jgi:hypothetical protein
VPLKIVGIPFEEEEVPFDAGSEMFSYIVYPVDEEKRTQFASLLCRWEHFYRQKIDPGWIITPHLIRPKRFESLGGIDCSELYRGMELIRRRLRTAAFILFPFLVAYTTKNRHRNARFFTATVNELCEQIIEEEGGVAASNLSNFKTREWSPTRPIAHLAFALFLEVYAKRYQRSSGRSKAIWEVLSPFPTDAKLQDVLETAEQIRRLLPSLAGVRFKEDDTIMFISSGGRAF